MVKRPQCWACREKRIRCGSETPTCVKCSVKGIQCPGYSRTRPLRWMRPFNPESQYHLRGKHNSQYLLQTKKSGGYPSNHVSLSGNSGSSVPVALRPAGLDLHDLVIAEEIMYYNERIAPDLVPTDNPANPFRWDISESLQAPLYLRHAFAAISIFHRIVQRRWDLSRLVVRPGSSTRSVTPTVTSALSTRESGELARAGSDQLDAEERRFYSYYASAIRSVNDALSRTSRSLDYSILGGVMMLLYSQLQQGAYGQWRTHLEGVKALIDSFGGSKILVLNDEEECMLVSNILLVDIMATTTCPVASMPPDTAERHQSYHRILSLLNRKGIQSSFYIPANLIKIIVEVNLIRAKSISTKVFGDAVECPVDYKISEVLSKLNHYTPLDGSTSHRSNPTYIDSRPENDPALSHPEGQGCPEIRDRLLLEARSYAHCAQCFRAAIKIYAVETYLAAELAGGCENCCDAGPILQSSSTRDRMIGARQIAYHELMESLKFLLGAKRRQEHGVHYWKFVFWPLAIAGVQSVIVHRNGPDFAFIHGQLLEMTADLGTMGMRDAAFLLEKLWTASTADTTTMTWDEVFKDAPLFLL
ncbi:hypothetical protein Asppvi_002323 [Aspergillus pseudoviridinutans]|uniref:Zn(2)-C6 fungal-type domain-containing protein n=1 Tax=Aspergillus pseudoviridinutans TaxID=1517512 RepID=A0A9P3ESA5_9EURO|nr:uncharacterized protein Asppvi_002323 [Aspergillus pseudoviridinutans]GIJ83500.1 hypothetical protein Asppvi_002323 [Aspergillus pseudoviridinutans]